MRVVRKFVEGQKSEIECAAIAIRSNVLPELALFETEQDYADNRFYKVVALDSVVAIEE